MYMYMYIYCLGHNWGDYMYPWHYHRLRCSRPIALAGFIQGQDHFWEAFSPAKSVTSVHPSSACSKRRQSCAAQAVS